MHVYLALNLSPFLILQFRSSCNSTPTTVEIIKTSCNSLRSYFYALQPAELGQARIIILFFLIFFYSEIYNTDWERQIITAWLNKVRATSELGSKRNSSTNKGGFHDRIKFNVIFKFKIFFYWGFISIILISSGRTQTIVAFDVKNNTKSVIIPLANKWYSLFCFVSCVKLWIIIEWSSVGLDTW